MPMVAALQMDARAADVAYNLDHVRELAMEAVRKGAKVISVPEFFTTSIVLDDRIWSCALPPENPALDMLKEVASDNNVLIGGSYLEKRDGDIFNCYTLVRPDGTVTRHDKDLPTMIENAFYIGGNTDGVHDTTIGRVGTAVCWELIRTQTLHRLRGKVDFVMSGTHWWTVALNWKWFRSYLDNADLEFRELFRVTPATFARSLGVANIHASHCGKLTGKYPVLPNRLWDVPYETRLLGETQIVDNLGNVIARMTADDGAGVLMAELDLQRSKPTLEIPNRFWIPELQSLAKLVWWHQNSVSKGIYRKAKADRKF